MKVGLFIPCYVDQLYPEVAVATLELLEKSGVDVHFPLQQTCCGQPMANSGFEADCSKVYSHFVEMFSAYDYIVVPSGSCAYHVTKHYNTIDQTPAVKHVRERTIELVAFLTEILQVQKVPVSFPYKVGLHLSCHGQRGLRHAAASEITPVRNGYARKLLESIDGLQLTELKRYDECCGFGGTFCITEEAVSARMGYDRIEDHVGCGTQVLTGGDMSCLMHLKGIIEKRNIPMRVMHLAEILNGNQP
jgi:L-lactate dehydrogenase complex protein LldE